MNLMQVRQYFFLNKIKQNRVINKGTYFRYLFTLITILLNKNNRAVCMLAKSVLRSLRLCFNQEKDSKERELERERERERERQQKIKFTDVGMNEEKEGEIKSVRLQQLRLCFLSFVAIKQSTD